MRAGIFAKSVIGVAVIAALAGCNSDTNVSSSGSSENPLDSSAGNFEGRYSFSSTFAGDVPAYGVTPGFEISDENGAKFIASALFSIVSADLPGLSNVAASRITDRVSDFEERNGLEPLFGSGFEVRTRNCKAGGQASIRVSDMPLDFKPTAGDLTGTQFTDCTDVFKDDPNPDSVITEFNSGKITTVVKDYDGMFGGNGNATDSAKANFSDVFDLTTRIFEGKTEQIELKQEGRVDYAVNRTAQSVITYSTTDNKKDVFTFTNAESKVIMETGEIAQREIAVPVGGTGDTQVRFEIFTGKSKDADGVDLTSRKISTEDRTESRSIPTVLGFYSSEGDPYFPVGPDRVTSGLTKGGMIAIGKNGSVELVFNQLDVGDFTNIVQVIKTEGDTVTHDCKVPYFTVFPRSANSEPRFSFAADGSCLVDGAAFPPVAPPPPPPPEPPVVEPSCFVRDLVETISENDPSPLSENLAVVLNPASDLLCQIVEPLQAQAPF